jgi:hypothetical protein
VKYQIYVEALKVARTERQKNRDEKRVNRLLEEADDDASINDPAYSPMPESSAGFASAQADVLDDDEDETNAGASAALQQHKASRADRASMATTTTSATTSEFHEANEGRSSQDY